MLLELEAHREPVGDDPLRQLPGFQLAVDGGEEEPEGTPVESAAFASRQVGIILVSLLRMKTYSAPCANA